MASVSIVTVTQLKRFPCLQILKDMIERQTYTNIIEWILVEGSPDNDILENAKNIQTLTSIIPILYLEKTPGEQLGALRNKGNRACKGDITVVMDDDDYYPPERVEEAVHKLQASKKMIAGCSDMYMYDYTLDRFYRFRKIPNHSVNSCLAWKREYLKDHSHDDNKSSGEEYSFTNGFTEPMVQLNPRKVIIQSSHMSNTYSKLNLLMNMSPIDGPELQEPFFTRMKKIFDVSSVF